MPDDGGRVTSQSAVGEHVYSFPADLELLPFQAFLQEPSRRLRHHSAAAGVRMHPVEEPAQLMLM